MTPLTPDQKARQHIDAALDAAGWVVQDRDEMNLSAGPGVAVREFQMATGHGFADYMLFVEGKAVGVLEAKPAGCPLTSVELQADKYATGLPAGLDPPVNPLPFLYMSTGVETRFINLLDPDPKTRRISDVPHIQRPSTLAEWLGADTLNAWVTRLNQDGGDVHLSTEDTRPSSLRARIQILPPVEIPNLWQNKVEAITNVEVTVSGAERLADEQIFVRSAALGCITGPSGAAKRKSRSTTRKWRFSSTASQKIGLSPVSLHPMPRPRQPTVSEPREMSRARPCVRACHRARDVPTGTKRGEETTMKWTRHHYAGLMVLALVASACGGAPTPEATEEVAMPEATGRTESSGEPVFLVDPLWPKALPEDWMFGNVVGVAVDSQDNVWIAHRPRSQNGSEGTPPVLAFDQDGNVVKSWGGQSAIPEWGTQEHGLYIDYQDNVWVGFGGGLPYDINTRATTDNAHFLKLSPDGELLLVVGEFGMGTEGSDSTTYLGQPTDVYVDPETDEAFIADGYTNRRVIVVDANTGEYKRHWGAYGNQPDDTRTQTMASRRTADGPQPQQFNTPHCLAGADDGLVYVCDRGNQRIQIFQRDGTFGVKPIPS